MLSQFPKQITAGLSLKCEVISSEYPAPDWTLTAHIRGSKSIDLISLAQGTAHLFAATATETASYDAGDYAVTVRAKKGDDVFEIESGSLIISADLGAVGDGHDAKSHARKVLTAIEAVIEGRASKDQESYTINGRSLTRTSIADLLTLRDRYKKEAAAEANGGKGGKLLRRKIKVRFGR